jgi:hypothetical protein
MRLGEANILDSLNGLNFLNQKFRFHGEQFIEFKPFSQALKVSILIS